MALSVHTNTSAMIALQNLNKTNEEITGVQNRINTGLKVSGAKDNFSVFAVAQGMRSDIGALAASSPRWIAQFPSATWPSRPEKASPTS